MNRHLHLKKDPLTGKKTVTVCSKNIKPTPTGPLLCETSDKYDFSRNRDKAYLLFDLRYKTIAFLKGKPVEVAFNEIQQEITDDMQAFKNIQAFLKEQEQGEISDNLTFRLQIFEALIKLYDETFFYHNLILTNNFIYAEMVTPKISESFSLKTFVLQETLPIVYELVDQIIFREYLLLRDISEVLK